MTLTNILILAALSSSAGVFLRGGRKAFMLVVSIVVIFWLQPPLPIRGFDFWAPLATLVLVVLAWFVTAEEETRKARKNIVVLVVVASVVLILNLARFLPPKFQILVASRPPQIETTLLVFLTTGLALWLLSRASRFNASLLTANIVLVVGLFLLVKIPTLSLCLSAALRGLAGQSPTNASPADFRWLGFSYVAFRILHTLRDKQMKRLPAVDLGEYLTYVIFFPAFVAGPIDRIERFVKDLRAPSAKINLELFYAASQRLLIGLFKKFVIADALALIALNDANALQIRSSFWMWIAVYAYAFQIYFDFSGYTDIALGMAQWLGIKLPENFLAPYLKPNLTQFWNNWHITLTQWFRAYFFNPVTRWMRSQKKPIPIPLMIFLAQTATMLLIGFWHGGAWNFALWGVWHGLGLFVHNRWSDAIKIKTSSMYQNALNIGGILLTFHFVALGWIFFALSSPAVAARVFLKLFGM